MGVAHRVGHRLHRDPVGRDLGRRAERRQHRWTDDGDPRRSIRRIRPVDREPVGPPSDRLHQADLVERRRTQLAGHSADLGDRGLGLARHLVEERLGGGGIVAHLAPRDPELERHRRERRAETVVQIAPEPAVRLRDCRKKGA